MRELRRLGLIPIEWLELDTGYTISDVRKNKSNEYIRHGPTSVME